MLMSNHQILFLIRCNVDRMNMLKKPLPIAGYEDVWLRISKIIGVFCSYLILQEII